MGSKAKSKKRKKPKPRVPLPRKPPKAELPAKVYRRRKKHPAKQGDVPDEEVDDSELSENDRA